MRIIASILLLVMMFVGSSSLPTQAQLPEGQTRCLLLGPLVISGYLEVFKQVAQKKRGIRLARAQARLPV